MRCLVAFSLVALTACGSPAPPPQAPVANTPPPAEPTADAPSGPTCDLPPIAGQIRGCVVDEATGEPVIGATVVATASSQPDRQIAEVTDEHGAYQLHGLELRAGDVLEIFVYFGDHRTDAPKLTNPPPVLAPIRISTEMSP